MKDLEKAFFIDVLLASLETKKPNEILSKAKRGSADRYKNLADCIWLSKYSKISNWVDNLQDVVWQALGLPLIPQQYNGDIRTSLATKLKDSSYNEFYGLFCDRVEQLKKERPSLTGTDYALTEAEKQFYCKLYTAILLEESYRKLKIDDALYMITKGQYNNTIQYRWYDCFGRIKYKENLKPLVKDILKVSGIQEKDSYFIDSYRVYYGSALASKLKRGMR